MFRRRWTQADLAARRKSDPLKLQIAARLRRETTLSINQIAECLHLRTTRSASVRLHPAMSRSTPTEQAQGAQGYLGMWKETPHVRA
ncbi:MAG: hypothetical protein ACLQM8_23340 [Limisphaerales bacterium]